MRLMSQIQASGTQCLRKTRDDEPRGQKVLSSVVLSHYLRGFLLVSQRDHNALYKENISIRESGKLVII